MTRTLCIAKMRLSRLYPIPPLITARASQVSSVRLTKYQLRRALERMWFTSGPKKVRGSNKCSKRVANQTCGYMRIQHYSHATTLFVSLCSWWITAGSHPQKLVNRRERRGGREEDGEGGGYEGEEEDE